MVTRLVQFSDEAYRRLNMRKRPGESFSDVVLRLTAAPGLEGLRGLRSKAEIAKARRQLRMIDELDRKDVDRWQSSTRRS